jgi:type III secretion system low calcium response chaperone LcrH/SycD
MEPSTNQAATPSPASTTPTDGVNGQPGQSVEMQQVMAKALDVLMTGGNLYTLRGMTEQDVEAVYALGHTHYTTGNYNEAENIFRGLCLLNHLSQRNWLGLGAAQQMQKKYQPALSSYSYAQVLDMMDPRPLMHIYECLMGMQEYPKAMEALEGLMKLTAKEPKHAALHAKAEGLHGALRDAIKKAGA